MLNTSEFGKYLCTCSNSENHATSETCENCLEDASLSAQMGVGTEEKRVGAKLLMNIQT